jgi:hypothetical protein
MSRNEAKGCIRLLQLLKLNLMVRNQPSQRGRQDCLVVYLQTPNDRRHMHAI